MVFETTFHSISNFWISNWNKIESGAQKALLVRTARWNLPFFVWSFIDPGAASLYCTVKHFQVTSFLPNWFRKVFWSSWKCGFKFDSERKLVALCVPLVHQKKWSFVASFQAVSRVTWKGEGNVWFRLGCARLSRKNYFKCIFSIPNFKIKFGWNIK